MGFYNVLLLGTRKDSLAVNNWKELGMEYISKEIGEAEKIISYNSTIETGEESQKEKTSQLSSYAITIDKKTSALEEDNKKLRKEIAALRTTSLRVAQMEERLKAIENMQMARK